MAWWPPATSSCWTSVGVWVFRPLLHDSARPAGHHNHITCPAGDCHRLKPQYGSRRTARTHRANGVGVFSGLEPGYIPHIYIGRACKLQNAVTMCKTGSNKHHSAATAHRYIITDSRQPPVYTTAMRAAAPAALAAPAFVPPPLTAAVSPHARPSAARFHPQCLLRQPAPPAPCPGSPAPLIARSALASPARWLRRMLRPKERAPALHGTGRSPALHAPSMLR
jgi:hypothetical protein